jgi:membrane protein
MKLPGMKGLEPKAVATAVYKKFQADAVTDSAAQLSYYLLFALFPFLVFLVTLIAYLPLGGAVQDLMAKLQAVMPKEAAGLISDHLNSLLTKPKPHLLGLGVLMTLYSASRGADAFRKSLNIAYDVHESRPFWKVNGVAFLATILGSVFGLLGIAMIALGGKGGEWVATKVHLGKQFVVVWSWLRWPTTMLVIMFVAAVGYYLLPDVKQKFKYITPGSASATVLWLVGTWAFGIYVSHFGNYNATYGSIGGVIVLMTWLYISGVIFMVGGEMNAVIEHMSAEGKEVGAHDFGQAAPPKAQRPSAAPPGAAKSADLAHEVHASNRRAAHNGELTGKRQGQPTRAPFFRFWKRPQPLKGPYFDPNQDNSGTRH